MVLYGFVWVVFLIFVFITFLLIYNIKLTNSTGDNKKKLF